MRKSIRMLAAGVVAAAVLAGASPAQAASTAKPRQGAAQPASKAKAPQGSKQAGLFPGFGGFFGGFDFGAAHATPRA